MEKSNSNNNKNLSIQLNLQANISNNTQNNNTYLPSNLNGNDINISLLGENNDNSNINPFKTDKSNPFLNSNNFNNININNINRIVTEQNTQNNNISIIPISDIQEENNTNTNMININNLNNNNSNLITIKESINNNLNLNNNINNNPLAIPAYTNLKPKFLYELNGAHTSTVNIIRFSPNGMYLASGGDDSAIVIWVQKSRPIEFGSNIEKIIWSNYKILRGHLSDIYDIAWSPDSKYLISGSVDNRALIWSLDKGKVIDRSIDHSHFVQGVSWDPKNKYVTTQSTDKSAKILCNANIKNEIKFYPNFVIKKYSKSNYALLMHNLANDINEENNLIQKENNKMDIDFEGLENNINSDVNSNISGNNNRNNINTTNNKVTNQNNVPIKKDKNNLNNNIHYFSDEIQCNSYLSLTLNNS